MQIIPAIDLKGGKCVRLTQGKFDQVQQYSNDPLKIAKRWESEGATRLHVVDLDGARLGAPSEENVLIVREIVRTLKIPVQLGGGIRNGATVKAMLEIGIDRVIIGTAAVSDPSIGELFREYGDRMILGLDAVNGMVAVHGWQQSTELSAIKFAQDMEAKGVRRIIFTDISRDGMLTGPNIPALESMIAAVTIPVIASGGVGTLDDIKLLAKTTTEGVIVGKSLYENTLSLPDAIAASSGK